MGPISPVVAGRHLYIESPRVCRSVPGVSGVVLEDGIVSQRVSWF